MNNEQQNEEESKNWKNTAKKVLMIALVLAIVAAVAHFHFGIGQDDEMNEVPAYMKIAENQTHSFWARCDGELSAFDINASNINSTEIRENCYFQIKDKSKSWTEQ